MEVQILLKQIFISLKLEKSRQLWDILKRREKNPE